MQGAGRSLTPSDPGRSLSSAPRPNGTRALRRHLDSCARRTSSGQAGRSRVDADGLYVGRSRILRAVPPARFRRQAGLCLVVPRGPALRGTATLADDRIRRRDPGQPASASATKRSSGIGPICVAADDRIRPGAGAGGRRLARIRCDANTRLEMRRLGLATVFARHVACRACRMASLVAGLLDGSFWWWDAI